MVDPVSLGCTVVYGVGKRRSIVRISLLIGVLRGAA